MKKYKLTNKTKEVDHAILHQIEALRDFGDVRKGDKGGWVNSEFNLSQDGECWLYGDAIAREHASVKDDAKLYDNAVIRGMARARGCAKAKGNAVIGGFSVIRDWSLVTENGKTCNNSILMGRSVVCGNAKIMDDTIIKGQCTISGNSCVVGRTVLRGHVSIGGTSYINVDCVIGDRDDINTTVLTNMVLTNRQIIRGGGLFKDRDDIMTFYGCFHDGTSLTYTRPTGLWHTDDFTGTKEELLAELIRLEWPFMDDYDMAFDTVKKLQNNKSV